MADSAELRLDNLTKRFGAQTVVNGVTLAIPQGEFVTLLGPSGCGKTTLLRMIAGFYEPDAGTISLGAERIDQLPAHRRGAAMVFQDYALFPHMTVRDNVGYGLRLARLPRAEIKRRTDETLSFLGMDGLAERWPNQLSGGQQQRVALARALIVEPKVLLLDEPLSNLDANFRERMRWELRALQQRLNITFLYVTHDQSEALAMSDWVAVMNAGRVEQWGTPREIYHAPASAFIATFIGTANLRPNDDGGLLCIRPEALSIGLTPRGAPMVDLAGRVVRSAFLGHLTRYWVEIAGEEWIIDRPDTGPDDAPFEGSVVVSYDPQQAHVIAGAAAGSS